MKQKKVSVHYVDNKKFFEEIVKYREKLDDARKQGLEDPRIPDYIGSCILKIAEKLSTKPCFMNYSYREEMISDGIENCIMYFKDYDPEKTQNPFAYFTQVIYFAFLRRIGKEEKNRYAMYKNFQHVIIHGNPTGGQGIPSEGFTHHDNFSFYLDSDDSVLLPARMYDNINEFMDKFERREEIKKEKRKQDKQGLAKFYEE